ncbi:uncharacterized protein LOC128135981 isoform X2 [Harpia harpyja]|uniref:uncharacterized protein LOC128135981 isoform X2 n=1 Tax=Harpia harpyja TaxID=202280 RepID=UPI0022B09C60|nr:uncharacterized protein LOC128135981 isoform X2 [Harpia harpyja]
MGPGLLLLLLLLLPWGALGNVGGSAGACTCTHRWPWKPPPAVRLPPLAPYVLRADLCPNHVRRFVLPHKQICGLQDSPWVVELLQLWERQAQRPLAGPLATDRPPDGRPATDRPTDGRPATDRPTDGPLARPPAMHGPPDGPPASPLAPLSPPAPEGPPASPTVKCSTPSSSSPTPHPAVRLGEEHGDESGGQLLGVPQALPPTPAGWIHREAVGQDPQMPPPAVGPAPLSVGLAMGVILLGAGLGLVGVLACSGGLPGSRERRGARLLTSA